MQVTNSEDKAVVATVATAQSNAFGVANTPEFFEILSKSLYQNPMLAMVREILCNAWDAHTDAGITDTPIKVTLNDDELVVTDFGSGIPHHKMVEIYCIYGSSTKAADSAQTGGFGLGCKSPFAYTDVFTVTNDYGGTRKIYSMVKSDTATNGMPSCTEVASMPTTNQGVSVSIPLTYGDSARILAYVGDVVRFGSMNMVADYFGEVTEGNPIALGTNVGDYIFTRERSVGIYVRYGSVVYPVSKQEGYAVEFDEILNFINRMNLQSVIIQAAPDSLCITPSRDELSYQELTQESLFDLFDQFIRTVPAKAKEAALTAFNSLAPELLKNQSIGVIAKWYLHGDSLSFSSAYLTKHLPKQQLDTDICEVVYAILQNSSLVEHVVGVHLSRKHYLDALIAQYPKHAKQLVDFAAYLRQRGNSTHSYFNIHSIASLPTRMVTPKYTKAFIAAQEVKQLIHMPCVYNPSLAKTDTQITPPYVTWKTSSVFSHRRASALVNPVEVVILHSKRDTRAQVRDAVKVPEGTIIIPMRDKSRIAAERVEQAFTAKGYKVHTLIDWEEVSRKAKALRDARKQGMKKENYKTPSGNKVILKDKVLSLNNLWDKEGNYVGYSGFRQHEEPEYIEPKAIILLNKSTGGSLLGGWFGTPSRDKFNRVAELWGNQIGIVQTATQAKKFAHLPHISEFVSKMAIKYLDSFTLLRKNQMAFAYKVNNLPYQTRTSRIVSFALEIPRLFPKSGLGGMTVDDNGDTEFVRWLADSTRWISTSIGKELHKKAVAALTQELPQDTQQTLRFLEKVTNTYGAVQIGSVSPLLKIAKLDPAQRTPEQKAQLESFIKIIRLLHKEYINAEN